MTELAAVVWADEMRLGLRGVVRRVWAPRGVKVVQSLQLTYTWRYLIVALNGLSGTLQWSWLPNMKQEGIAQTVASWQAAGVAGVVWDGAASHRSRLVRAQGLPLVSQPPAAPELNPAERLFQEVRRAIEGRSYPTIDDKIAAADAYLHALAADLHRLRSLTGWAWIRDALTTPFPALS